MNGNESKVEIGSTLGHEAVDQVAHYAAGICEHECERIKLTSEAQINQLNVEGTELSRIKQNLEERLRFAPPVGSIRLQRTKIAYSILTAGILIVGGFGLAVVSLNPFRLRPTALLLCVGSALGVAFLTELALEAWEHPTVLRMVITAAFAAALVGSALLAEIRGDLMAQQVQTPTPSVTIDDATPQPTQQENSFYESTGSLLRLLMVLFSFAMDLGAGLAAHRAIRLSSSLQEDSEKLGCELKSVNSRLGELVFEITMLRNSAAEFEQKFWRDFYRAMLTQTVRKALPKLLVLSLCIGFAAARTVSAQQHPQVVIALDLSASEAVKAPDGQSQFQRNVLAVSHVLDAVPQSARVTVIGITEDSFSQPDIILSAQVGDDAGYFGEKLQAAHRQLSHAWRNRALQLQAQAKGTDVFGALLVAGQLFRQHPEELQKSLFIFSDMRNTSRGFNFEARGSVPLPETLARVQKAKLLSDLSAVSVEVPGADAVGMTAMQYEQLHEFWSRYLGSCGATLRSYSVLSQPAGER